ncbi:MAG: hypothetical protein AW10_04156 [Candidatus Accumulibacter appositus]|uniref:DUF5666 domain-containing protein n=1 Tax=Candidatus Accumulibacter appositus TaxID=1454003 RepID=A0A011QCT5_9PROT|nr:MAG: hypothetical protein AW10_04156 [Candidatus Accumulibacter appositus]
MRIRSIRTTASTRTVRGLVASAALAAVALLPFSVSAQQAPEAAAMTASAPGEFVGMVEAQVSLVVKAIDKATRAVVLQDDQGEEMVITASDAVKNFDQIKVGDEVAASYTQTLVMKLKKGGGDLRVRIDSSDAQAAKPGDKPAAAVVKDVAFIADVDAVDRKTQMITLRGAKKTVKLKIKDPEQLKLINKGDQIEGVYSEAIAVSVVPASAKKAK